MAETLDLSLFVEPGDAGASHMMLAVEGVSCAGCIRKIENGLNTLPGVIDARINFTQRRLAVDWRNDEIDAAKRPSFAPTATQCPAWPAERVIDNAAALCPSRTSILANLTPSYLLLIRSSHRLEHI